MAEVYVKNALNPHKVIKVGVSFTQTVDYNTHDGDLIWALEVGTPEPHYEGGKIPPVFITDFDLDNLDEEISRAIGRVSSKVDWGLLEEDVEAPFVESVEQPTSYIVDMNNMLDVIIKEALPSSGIDKDSINVKVNGIDVSDELLIHGTPFKYRIIWHPKIKVHDTYL